jgi:hypothetical protein
VIVIRMSVQISRHPPRSWGTWNQDHYDLSGNLIGGTHCDGMIIGARIVPGADYPFPSVRLGARLSLTLILVKTPSGSCMRMQSDLQAVQYGGFRAMQDWGERLSITNSPHKGEQAHAHVDRRPPFAERAELTTSLGGQMITMMQTTKTR